MREHNQRSATKIGHAASPAHFGELFQGQLEDCLGRRRRCLVSLPCGVFYSSAQFVPGKSREVVVTPSHKVRAHRAVETFAEACGLKVGGQLTIESNIQEGKGLGSSTSDCIAAIRAVADAFGITLSEQLIAALVVNAECASDSTMFNHTVLFAQREGIILEDYGLPFPRIEVIGVDTESDREIDTLAFQPAEYNWRLVQKFETLRGALRRGLRTNDVRILGQVSTASALINQEFLPKACFDELILIAKHAHALGVVVAHSGTLAGFLLDPRAPTSDRQATFIVEKLRELGMPVLTRFHTSQPIYGANHDEQYVGTHFGELSSGLDTTRLKPDSHGFSHHENLSG